MKPREPVTCNVPSCGKTWPRDPVLEVPCPHSLCLAKVGQLCGESRPSEHRTSPGFSPSVNQQWGGHDVRDAAAMAAGAYGPCPYGRCSLAPDYPADEAPAEPVKPRRSKRARPESAPEQPSLF